MTADEIAVAQVRHATKALDKLRAEIDSDPTPASGTPRPAPCDWCDRPSTGWTVTDRVRTPHDPGGHPPTRTSRQQRRHQVTIIDLTVPTVAAEHARTLQLIDHAAKGLDLLRHDLGLPVDACNPHGLPRPRPLRVIPGGKDDGS